MLALLMSAKSRGGYHDIDVVSYVPSRDPAQPWESTLKTLSVSEADVALLQGKARDGWPVVQFEEISQELQRKDGKGTFILRTATALSVAGDLKDFKVGARGLEPVTQAAKMKVA